MKTHQPDISSIGAAGATAAPAACAAAVRPARAGRPARFGGARLRRAGMLTALVGALGLTACADMQGIASHARLRDGASLGLPAATAAAPGTPTASAEAGGSSNTDTFAVPERWWTRFGDPQLDALIDQALASNPNLQMAQARLARAEAATGVAEAATGPQLNGSLDLTRQRYSANGLYPAPLAGSTRNSGTLQLNGSWEIDFFGRNRAVLDAALGSAQAAAADAQAARVLLAANVARNWFQLARLNAQQEVAQRTLAQRQETLQLVRDRVDAGLDTRLELRQSEGGLPDARQQIEALNEQIALTRNALGVLVGQPGAAQTLVPPALADVESRGALLPGTIPADLLGRRADISAARWRVEAATQDVGSARAQFYPNVNLIAFAGFSSLGLDRLLEGGSRQWGIGPAIRLPIFDAGRLRANLRGRVADLDNAVESYNATVLDAVREVADQVASAQSLVRQRTEQRAAQQAAEGAYDIAVQRYRAGLGTYLQVLTAESTVLLQRRQAVDLAARALDAQVLLARALGGGYDAAAPAAVPGIPAVAAVSATPR